MGKTGFERNLSGGSTSFLVSDVYVLYAIACKLCELGIESANICPQEIFFNRKFPLVNLPSLTCCRCICRLEILVSLWKHPYALRSKNFERKSSLAVAGRTGNPAGGRRKVLRQIKVIAYVKNAPKVRSGEKFRHKKTYFSLLSIYYRIIIDCANC